MAKLHLLAALAVILLSAVVQAQWPWNWSSSAGGRDDEDDESSSRPWAWNSRTRTTSRTSARQSQPSSWQNTPQNPWGQQSQQPQQQPQPRPTQQPQQPQQPQQQPKPPKQSTWGPRPPVVVTVTVTKSREQTQRPGTTQKPTNPPVIAQPPPGSTRTWTQPSAWGPPRNPFGANPTPTGPQTIPTTTTEPYKEPVPYLTTCGRTKYVEYDVSNAITVGCWYKNKTQTIGAEKFPKRFENTYGFNFGDVKPPFYEYPLIDSAAYAGGIPGPDRVIFNEQCFLAGEITQSNAGARGYTECIEQY